MHGTLGALSTQSPLNLYTISTQSPHAEVLQILKRLKMLKASFLPLSPIANQRTVLSGLVLWMVYLPAFADGIQIHGSFTWRDACHLGTHLNTWEPTEKDERQLGIDLNSCPDEMTYVETNLQNPFLYPFTHVGLPPSSTYSLTDKFDGRVYGTNQEERGELDNAEPFATRGGTNLPVPASVVCAINAHGTHYFLRDINGAVRSCTWASHADFYSRVMTAHDLMKWIINKQRTLGESRVCPDNLYDFDVSGISRAEDRFIFGIAAHIDISDDDTLE